MVCLTWLGSRFQRLTTACNSGSIGAKKGQLERSECCDGAAQAPPPCSQVFGWLILKFSSGSNPVPSALYGLAWLMSTDQCNPMVGHLSCWTHEAVYGIPGKTADCVFFKSRQIQKVYWAYLAAGAKWASGM